ncbi:MAG: class II fumarate hydratase [Nitrospirota bacterium]|jgi:fumarate hydratase class II
MSEYRIEKDSLGEVRVPRDALWGAQTQRAIDNFPVSGVRFPRTFIRALGIIKGAAAAANAELGLLDRRRAGAVKKASEEVEKGALDDHFPLDVFQTGSATSTNMNANEVIAHRAMQLLRGKLNVHPNDHVNMCQSSNDVIPSALHISACLDTRERLLPALRLLEEAIAGRAAELKGVAKTGRTHLMDALPITFGQELGGWAHQVGEGAEKIESALPSLGRLALGGTAVGTGVNAHPKFARKAIAGISRATGIRFSETKNHFASQSSMDAAAGLSSQIKVLASSLMKIANDLRWLSSGPVAGLSEITIPALQPGSSIMPGKVNPVICETMMMACGQAMANDLAVTIGNERGNFQLNVMLPLIARNLLESINVMAGASELLAEKAVAGFTPNVWRLDDLIGRNLMLVTALNPVIGYDRAAEIAKKAYAECRPVREVAAELTDLSPGELDRILDPRKLTRGGMFKPRKS